jgi:8-oxo-dGTP diphosphatase
MMIEFMDISGKKVELCFERHCFEEQAQHVLIMCEEDRGWVLTNHKKRGWEFPGGKRESGETLEEAAHREVYEETGAILASLRKIGEYRVSGEGESFVKAVFWGKVGKMENKVDYMETNGPVIAGSGLLTERFQPHYSFIMKDKTVEACIQRIQQLRNK